ncbi:prenyltransferase/squalene oxidase repeat-containing protein [Paraliomyxa miuraensis]|uniref:hypothetical protein n=1 Tax=Paraliomyxa miuraensis TaxID=376150 RepID=UPI00225C3B1B|nr:hypothetical protein [Paraliomyxa miuraensis]MCX4241821.1 hypothetical protein [Paraliomyxa miuraensis]
MAQDSTALPRFAPALLSGLVAAVLGWGATVLPWREFTPFAITTTITAVAHGGHAALALLGHSRRGLAWRVQSLTALAYLGYITWHIFSASTYIAALYGGLGKGVAAGLAAAWAVVAFLLLPLAVWGLAVTGGMRWNRRAQGGTAVALLLAGVGLWRAAASAEAEAAIDPASLEGDALSKALASVLPDPAGLPEPPADAPSLLVRQAIECEAPPGPGLVTVVATSLVEVAPTRAEARSRCVQGATLPQALAALEAQLKAQALRGPIEIDVVTGTQDLEHVVPVVDAMLLRPGLDGVCEGTRCLMPWQLLAHDQFNEFMPIKVIPDLRFGFDPAQLRKALSWPSVPERFDPRVEGLRRLEVRSFVQDAGGQLHALHRMREPAPPLDAASLQAAVDAAERYILSAQGFDGRFEYKANPFTGQVSYQGFALARQAGTTLVICELARDHQRAREVARKALAMLVRSMQTHEDLGFVVYPIGKKVERVGLGSTALTSIALLSCRERVGDEFDEAIGRMTRFLLHMRREDGGFHPELDLTTGEPIPGPDPLYAVGQAVFALSLLERLQTEQALPGLPPAELTREVVDAAMTYTANDYWSGFAADFFFMEENWHCLAARASLGHHRHDGYERFCIDYTRYKTRLILAESDGVTPELVGGYGFGNVLIPHNTGSSGFGEAMSAALALERARGEDTTAHEEVLRRALHFLVQQQWDEVSCFACATKPHPMVGAFSEHMGSPEIRIDFVQHAMAGMGHGGRMLGLVEGSSIPEPLQ